MAAFLVAPARGTFFPRNPPILVPRAAARQAVHRTSFATAIRGAIGQVLVCVWSVLALGFLLVVLAGFFAR
jgi:hypothetical protein